MPIQCPHCQNAVEASAGAGGEVLCPACGSTFRLEQESTRTYIALKRRLGKFELIEQVGSGSFGAVWQARDTELGRIVAVKIPHAGQLASEKEAERFVREARSAAQLRHPGIVTVHEVGRFENVPYIVADFIRGQTLADRLQVGKLEQREAVELVAQVAEALDYAHAMGVVHRDVKPSNIMLERGGSSISSGQGTPLGSGMQGSAGRALLMDFGLALRADVEATMTQEGEVLGTPAYMSPEQAEGRSHKVDARSDVYSLGVVLYRLLTGVLPFQGNARAILDQVLHGEAPAPRKVDRTIDRDLETICLKAMARAAGDRYKTARDFGEDLRRYLAGEPIGARPLAFWERGWRWAKRRPAAAAAVGLGVVAVLTLVGLGVALGYQTQLRRAFGEVAQQKSIAEEQTRIAERESRESQAQRTLAENRLHLNHLVVAERELSGNNAARAKELLALIPEGQRGWEWHFLNRQCQGQLQILRGHENQVLGVRYSPDGRYIASASYDRTVRLWDGATGAPLRVWQTDGWSIAVRFTPDSKRLIASIGWYNDPHSIVIWDVASGQEVAKYLGHEGPIYGLDLSGDGEVLASADSTGVIQIRQTHSGQLLRTIDARKTGTSNVLLIEDGKQVVAAQGVNDVFALDQAGWLTVWDLRTGAEIRSFEAHEASVMALALRPDGEQFASASYDGTVRLWTLPGFEEQRICRGHGQFVSTVAYSPDGEWLVSGSDDGTARVWGSSDGQERLVLRGHAGPVNGVCFRPDGRQIVTGSLDKTVRIWDATSAPGVKTLRGDGQPVSIIAYSPGAGELVASGHRYGYLALWDAQTGKPARVLRTEGLPIWGLAFSPDGRFLATAAGDHANAKARGEILIWDVATGKVVQTLDGHDSVAWTVAYSPDGRRLASSAGELTRGRGEVKLWDPTTGRLVHDLAVPRQGGVYGVAFSGDGSELVTSGPGGSITMWDAATGEQKATYPGHKDMVFSLSFAASGKRLVTASYDQTVLLWDLIGKPVARTLSGHANGVPQAVFSPDGTRIASASWDQTVKLWDASNGEELLTLRGHTSVVWSVAFSPDGKRLASGSSDGTIKIWDATPLPEEAGR